MKKILIVSNVPFWGGGENFIAETLSRLSVYFDLRYIVLNEQLYNILPKEERFRFRNKRLWGQYRELIEIKKREKPDLILFNGGSIFYFLPFICCRKVLYRHSTDKYAPSLWRWLYKIVMNIAYYFADMTIHVSEYSRSEQLLNKDKSICIHNGIELTKPIKRSDVHSPLKILYCSRLEESKGIRLVIEAFKQIDKNMAELHVIGTGSLERWVKENASECVKIWGFRNDVETFYRSSDAMILMSEYENCPISVLEAMSYSLPIITSGAGGIAEQVKDGYNGLITERTPEAIKKAVLQLVDNPTKCIEMGENAYVICRESFDICKKVKDIYHTIEKVLEE